MNRTIRTEHDRAQLLRLLERRELPFVVSVAKGNKRSIDQNRLLQQRINDVAQQLGDRTAEEVRGDTKLRFGVPILRAEDEGFRQVYDERVKPWPYEHKLALMCEPLDMPVTRLLSVEQFTRMLDNMERYYNERGLVLTQPAEA